MHFVDEGEGEPLVFVHGNPTWSFEFRYPIQVLRSEFRCVAPDHIGFGLSSRSARCEDHHPESHAHRFAAFLDYLDLRDITLFMTDWGVEGEPLVFVHGRSFGRPRLRAQASGARQASRHREHLVLAGRRRLPFQVVQLLDVELVRPVPYPASQPIREQGDAEGGRRPECPDAGDHGALPQRAAVAHRARGKRCAAGLHRRRERLVAFDLG